MTPMTFRLPAPPEAALKAALHRLKDRGLYRTLAVDRIATSGGGGDDFAATVTDSHYANEARVDRLSSWARDVFAAFAPLPLVRASFTFATVVGRPYWAPAAGGGGPQLPLLSLTRCVGDHWAKIGGEAPVVVQMTLDRVSGTGPLTFTLCAGGAVGRVFAMNPCGCGSIWRDSLVDWLDGVVRLSLSFRWPARPSAHFLAELAAGEARP